jgi:hypothetical protein
MRATSEKDCKVDAVDSALVSKEKAETERKAASIAKQNDSRSAPNAPVDEATAILDKLPAKYEVRVGGNERFDGTYHRKRNVSNSTSVYKHSSGFILSRHSTGQWGIGDGKVYHLLSRKACDYPDAGCVLWYLLVGDEYVPTSQVHIFAGRDEALPSARKNIAHHVSSDDSSTAAVAGDSAMRGTSERADAERREAAAEAKRVVKEKAKVERKATATAEEERVLNKKAEAELVTRERDDTERIATAAAEAKRAVKKKAEAERRAAVAEAKRLAEERPEAERRATAAAEAERVAKERAEARRQRLR